MVRRGASGIKGASLEAFAFRSHGLAVVVCFLLCHWQMRGVNGGEGEEGGRRRKGRIEVGAVGDLGSRMSPSHGYVRVEGVLA